MAEPLPQRGVQALRQLVDDMARHRAALHPAPAQPPAAASTPTTASTTTPTRRAPKVAAAPAPAPTPVPPTVPGLDYFRNTWGRMQVKQRVARTLARPPDNAGPLNSHLLALRALQQMQSLSPAYLARFVAYLDALLWVDQAAAAVPLAPATRGEGDEKRKPARGGPNKGRYHVAFK